MDLLEVPGALTTPAAASNYLQGTAAAEGNASQTPSGTPAVPTPLQHLLSNIRGYVDELSDERQPLELVVFDGLHAEDCVAADGEGGGQTEDLRRVSLLSRLPEVAVRAVADAAGELPRFVIIW